MADEPDLLARAYDEWEQEYVQIAHLGDQGADVTRRHFQKLLQAAAQRARQQAREVKARHPRLQERGADALDDFARLLEVEAAVGEKS